MPGAIVERGERVTLRTVEEEDDPFVQRVLANPELRYPIGNPVRSLADMEDRTSDGDGDRFLVCLDADDAGPGDPGADETRPIGQVLVTDADWRRPELGFWIAPEFQGEGYGTEAVALAIEHAFRSYDRPAIEAKAYDFNDASRGLLESLGFEEEGRLRKRRFIDVRKSRRDFRSPSEREAF